MALKIVPGAPPPQPPSSKVLPVAHLIQSETEWCWAACAEMVIDYYLGQIMTQCDIANALLGKNSCCQSPGKCNYPCTIPQVAQLYNAFSVSSTYHSSALGFASIQSEINANRPVEVCFAWFGGGGHLAIIRGWEQNSGGNWIRINDPDLWLHQNNGQGKVLYSSLAKPYGIGNWVATWTDLK